MTGLDGVLVHPLKKVLNERGHLQEIQRSDDPHFPGFGQVYTTSTLPGVVKAWYRHRRQLDQIAILQGDLLLALFDSRDASPSRGRLQAIRLTGEAPTLVQIPPGIWHGFQALGPTPALILHLNTVPFDPDDLDEERLPADTPEIPHRW